MNEEFDEVTVHLQSEMKGKVTRSAPIAKLVSFRVGGSAAVLAEPKDEDDLHALYRTYTKFSLPLLILGRGTNVLVSDQGFPGIVVQLAKSFDWIEATANGVEAGGAAALPMAANKAARQRLTGLEFTVAIPATVGGAVRMNAGAHGRSIADVLESAKVFHLAKGRVEEVDARGLDMSYRHTNLGPGDIVMAATFELSRGTAANIASLMEEYRAHRAATQPTDAPNAGSMFKNPIDLAPPKSPEGSAGHLIESCGLKGYRVGGAQVSRKHANFFLAHQGATSQDVYDLMAKVQASVEEASGVLLIPEVRIVGRFQREEKLRV